MAVAVRLVLALAAGILVATFLPREVGRELHVALKWELALDDRLPFADRSDSSRGASFVAQTAERFALVETASGIPVVAGLRPPVFEPSALGYIGQSGEAPRWAVQSWEGRMVATVSRYGIPRLHESLLLQFSDEDIAFLSSLDGSINQEFGLPENPTVYDLMRAPDGTAFLAVGAMDGTVRVFSSEESTPWEHRFGFQRYSGESPVVYSLAFMPGGSGSLPRLLLLQGLNPQRVLLGELRTDGTMGIEPVFSVADERSVRWPTTIQVDEGGHVTIALMGAIAMADTASERIRILDIPGSTGVEGSVRLSGSRRLLAGSRPSGGYLVFDDGARDTTVEWPLPEMTVTHVDSDTALTVLQHGNALIALEVTI